MYFQQNKYSFKGLMNTLRVNQNSVLVSFLFTIVLQIITKDFKTEFLKLKCVQFIFSRLTSILNVFSQGILYYII